MTSRIPWTRQQLLVALSLYCRLPYGRIHHRNPEIIRYAKAIGRTPSALAMKLVNIAGIDPVITSSGRRGLTNASRSDREIWEQMHADWNRFVAESHQARDECGLVPESEEDLTEIAGIGPKIAESVVSYFKVAANRDVIAKLAAAGVNPTHEISIPETPERLPLHGLTFVITGTLSAFSRKEAGTRIKALGGGVTSSVSAKTNYLVAGESAGSKLDTAIRLNTPVLDEVAFLALLEDPASAIDVSSLPEEPT